MANPRYLVLCLALVGCAGGPDAPSLGASDETLRAALMLSAERWSDSTGWYIEISRKPDVPVFWAEFSGPESAWYCSKPAQVEVCRDALARNRTDYAIILRRGMTDWMDVVMTHEVGHAIAAPNDTGRHHTMSGIMADSVEGARSCITRADVALICQGQCPAPDPEC